MHTICKLSQYFQHGRVQTDEVIASAVRLSFVGEAGWKITCKETDGTTLFRSMVAAGAKPAGLFAQTAMRIEKRFLAHGLDLDTDITPVEAGLEFAVAWNIDFIGRAALLRRREEGPAQRMVSVLLDDVEAVPLGNEPIHGGNEIVGKTTSAAFGYRVGRPVALAHVKTGQGVDVEGARVQIDIASARFDDTITLKPAFDPHGKRMRVGG